jgi:hypothetical protein
MQLAHMKRYFLLISSHSVSTSLLQVEKSEVSITGDFQIKQQGL